MISKEHFSVDGTLLEARVSLKSFKPKDSPPPEGPGSSGGRNEEVDSHGERRSNKTHASKTDPEALLAIKCKSKETKLCCSDREDPRPGADIKEGWSLCLLAH